MIDFKGRTTYTMVSNIGETVNFPIKIIEFKAFLDWYEKTKNHYHFKTDYMNKLLDKIKEECQRENLVLIDITITLTLQHPADR